MHWYVMQWAHPCYFENRIPLKPTLGGVYSLTNYSVAYEETQSNRVSDFRDCVCSLFPKAILFYFYLTNLESQRFSCCIIFCFLRISKLRQMQEVVWNVCKIYKMDLQHFCCSYISICCSLSFPCTGFDHILFYFVISWNSNFIPGW